MGKSSRDKWDRRIESTRQESNRENTGRWLMSVLLLPVILAVASALIVLGPGIEMVPLGAVIWLGASAAIVVLWLLSRAEHRKIAIGLTICGLSLAIILSVLAYKYDRPILTPDIGGIITQNYRDKWLALDVEANVLNSGRQASYARSWQADLIIKGKRFHGRQLIGEGLPVGATHLEEIRDKDFPVEKPVSGWLFFAFPDIVHLDFERYSSCDSKEAGDVDLTLTVTDSKQGRDFSQTRNLGELLGENCSSLKPGPNQ